VQVVTVGGGGGGGAAAATPTTGPAASSAAAIKTPKVHLTQKVAKAATAAASKALGGSANLAPPTAAVGSSCANGAAGCQNGHFTGQFFGGP
jgi:hypothetical protein